MKTYEVYIDRTETVIVQALDIDDAKAHALGEQPDAPGCVLQSFGEETNDVRAVRVADEPERAAVEQLPGGPEVDQGSGITREERELIDLQTYRAALEQIAQDRAVYAPELQNIARRALGLPAFGEAAPGPLAQGTAFP